MLVRDLQILLKILFRRRPPVNAQKVNDLNKEPCLAAGCFAHRIDQLLQARHEPVVTDAQQRPTGNVANAGRLDDDRPRFSLGIAAVPVEQLLR
jgi:hypothetical protein